MRSSLARFQSDGRLDPHELRDRAVRCWHENALVVLRLDDVRDPDDRRKIEEVATRLYGRRRER